MKRLFGITLVFAATALLITSVLAQDDPFPWDQVVGVDVASLDDDTKAAVEELTAEIPNYHGCRGSVAFCISKDEPDPTARRLAGFLARRVAAGETREQIEERIVNRRRSAHPRVTAEIDTIDAPCIGTDTPLVTIVEFADFECPYCRIASPALEQLVRARSEEVRYCFKHFPIRTHERGVPSSIAALAAHRQQRFWEMHDALYASAPQLEDGDLDRCAQQVGLDLERYQRDIADEALLEEAMADKFEGQELGVDRTPTIFINGKQYFGELSEVELVDRIDEELDLTRQ